jgi:hypothetical protein
MKQMFISGSFKVHSFKGKEFLFFNCTLGIDIKGGLKMEGAGRHTVEMETVHHACYIRKQSRDCFNVVLSVGELRMS